MKRFLIILALLALLVMPASADVLTPTLWYNGSSPTNGETLNETCHLWAIENAEDPDRWFRKSAYYTNFYRQYYSNNPTTYTDYADDGDLNADDIMEMPLDWTKAPNSSLGYSTVNWHLGCCKDNDYTCGVKVLTGWTWTSDYAEVVANFTGTPTSGAAPLYVMFDDASTNETGTCTYNWTLTPASGIAAGATGTLENHAASFTVPGNYTVSHGVSCEGGSNISTKTDYIIVYNATTDYITTHFVVMDEPRWAQLAGSTINMLDIENNSWVNVSSSATGYEGITTLNNHTISAFASMTGYNDDELLAQPAWSGGDYRLLLFPENYGNVSAGNVTVYVSVYDTDLSSNEGRVADAAVNMAYVSGSDRVNDYRITDDAGMVSFVVPNQTTIYLYAEKAGYTRGGTTISSGNGNGGSAAVYAEITIGRTSVTTAPTVTTLPGGGTPAPTVDPYPCDADHPENCKRKQTEMGNTLIQYGPQLLLLFIIATFVGVIKMMGK